MTSLSRHAVGLLLTATLTASSALVVYAQPSVDTTFGANLTKVPEGDARGIFPQPDGKVFVTGAFKVAGGLARDSVVKLNSDGSVDPSFMGPDFRANEPFNPARIMDLAIQSTGKILVGGEFYEVDGQPKYRLVRLNANGSLDTSFAPQPLTWVVTKILVLSDDKIVIGGGFRYSDPSGPRNQLVRLNADGTLDTPFRFSPEPPNVVSGLVLQSDGKLVVATGNNVIRYATTGASDATFGPIACDNSVNTVKQQADGRLVIGGIFTNVNGFGLPRLFRTTSEGAIDASFTGSVPNGAVNAIAIAIDQKILIGGGFTLYGTVARKRSALLDQNGNLITGFDPSANPVNYVYAVAVQTDGKPFIGGQGDPSPAVNAPLVFRTNLDGTLDAGFDARIGFNGIGARLRVQPDAKILASGQFRNAYASDRFDIVRFNADGSLDVGFIPSTFIGIEASTILTGLDVQADGKILRAGTSSTGSGGTADRLQADGSFDFNIQNPNRPRDIRVLPNGQILYSTVNSLKRLNSNLTVDATFATTISGDVYRIALQSDGKILIGGSFTQVNGANRNGIARLNFDGTLDTTFNFFGGANGTVYDIAIQTDGKLIIAGEFTGVNFDTARKYIARLNSDGSLDTGYAPSVNAPVYALKFQPDGRLLIGGDMTLVNGVARTRFARLNANGSLEPSFNISTNDTVRSIELQADGKILYAGEFTKTNGQSTVGIGRLLNPAVPARTPFDFDGDGRADISVFRSSTNRWYELFSSDGTVAEETFGLSGDIVVPADFDGDGKTDEAIFRPSNGQWWYKSSIDGSQIANPFGQNGDIPRPSDFDGDGKADLVLFRPSTNTWFRFGSLTNQEAAPTVFGVTGDQPLVGDFDGDGKSDLAVFRPSNGDWWYAASSAGGAFRNVHWGQNGDIPVPADYDGDGRTDYAVYRPSEGGWYIYNSGNGSFTTIAFGISTDRPVAADYDGDGRADIAVFRPSTGIWYLLQSTSGFAGYQFGINTDTALPGALIP